MMEDGSAPLRDPWTDFPRGVTQKLFRKAPESDIGGRVIYKLPYTKHAFPFEGDTHEVHEPH
jgi:hypothetical protein